MGLNWNQFHLIKLKCFAYKFARYSDEAKWEQSLADLVNARTFWLLINCSSFCWFLCFAISFPCCYMDGFQWVIWSYFSLLVCYERICVVVNNLTLNIWKASSSSDFVYWLSKQQCTYNIIFTRIGYDQ